MLWCRVHTYSSFTIQLSPQGSAASRCRCWTSSRGIARLIRCDAQAPEPFWQVQIVASCGELRNGGPQAGRDEMQVTDRKAA